MWVLRFLNACVFLPGSVDIAQPTNCTFVSFGHVSTVLGTCSLLATLGTSVPQTLSLPVLGAAVLGFFTPSPTAVCPDVVFSKGPAFLPNAAVSCSHSPLPGSFLTGHSRSNSLHRVLSCVLTGYQFSFHCYELRPGGPCPGPGTGQVSNRQMTGRLQSGPQRQVVKGSSLVLLTSQLEGFASLCRQDCPVACHKRQRGWGRS